VGGGGGADNTCVYSGTCSVRDFKGLQPDVRLQTSSDHPVFPSTDNRTIVPQYSGTSLGPTSGDPQNLFSLSEVLLIRI
jgi:hypothetical protein